MARLTRPMSKPAPPRISKNPLTWTSRSGEAQEAPAPTERSERRTRAVRNRRLRRPSSRRRTTRARRLERGLLWMTFKQDHTRSAPSLIRWPERATMLRHAPRRAARPDPPLRGPRRRGSRGARAAADREDVQAGRDGLHQGRQGLVDVHRAVGRGADLPAAQGQGRRRPSSSRTCARASTSASSRSSTTSRARASVRVHGGRGAPRAHARGARRAPRALEERRR